MIKVVRTDIEDINHLQVRRLSFPLKVSRNVWLTDDKLVLEYPLKFKKLQNMGEAVAFSLLPIAFREASNIELPASLSIEKGTQERIDKICTLWNKWFSCNRKVKVFANTVEPLIFNGKQRYGAQLFSGGVDSLATFKRNRNRIRYLVLYNGADIPVTQPKLFTKVKKYTKEFAQEQNKELITLSTNVNYLGAASWVYMAHGCAMAGPLLALSNYINKIYIAATHFGEWARKIRLGTHPDLDPLVSTASVETIHDGFELKRPEKITLLATELALLKRLRVCGNIDFFDLKDGTTINRYNCGKCEKCYRTATVLTLLGISSKQVPFPKETLSLHNISNFLQTNELRNGLKLEWCKNLEFLESSSTNREGKEELKSMLRKVLGDFYENYKRDFPHGPAVRNISKWRNLEKTFGLEPDSLQWCKQLIRSFRGIAYKNFVKQDEHLTKIT